MGDTMDISVYNNKDCRDELMLEEGVGLQQGECVTNVGKFSYEFGWTEGCLAQASTPSSVVQVSLDGFYIYLNDECEAEVVEDTVKFLN